MSAHDSRSGTPSRRFGQIFESITLDGGETEERRESCGSEAKRMFRERRQKGCLRNNNNNNSSGSGSGNSTTTPERRQQASNASPLRRYNERRNSGGRPPTPDRSINRSTTPDRSQGRPDSPSQGHCGGRLSSSQIGPFENIGKGISLRALSKSPARRRANAEADPFGPFVSNQLPKDTIVTETREGPDSTGPTPSESMQERNTNQTGNIAATATPAGNKKEIEGDEKGTVSATATTTATATATATVADESKGTVSFSSTDSSQMKKIIQAQNEQIKFYERRLNTQSTEIEKLKFELQQSKRNEAKLELELEIHDVKYSMYDDYRRMMDRRRLDGKNDDDDDIDWDSESSQFAQSCAAFSKLERLHKLHEKSKSDADSRYKMLQAEYDRVVSESREQKEERPRDTNTTGPSVATDAESTESAAMLSLLEKRIKILESENQRYLSDIQRKQAEVDGAKSNRNNSARDKDENETKSQKLETQTLANKIVALETEIGFTSGQIDNRTRTSRYRALEKNLNEYVVEIMGLEEQLKSKEKIISRLKERELDRNGQPSSESRPKWYERASKGGKTSAAPTYRPVTGTTLFSADRSRESYRVSASNMKKDGGKTADDDSQPLAGEKIEAVSTYITRNIGGNNNKFDSRRINNNNRRGHTTTSTRIAMLRRRLDAIANDHSSVCTEETLYSAKTTPYF